MLTSATSRHKGRSCKADIRADLQAELSAKRFHVKSETNAALNVMTDFKSNILNDTLVYNPINI